MLPTLHIVLIPKASWVVCYWLIAFSEHMNTDIYIHIYIYIYRRRLQIRKRSEARQGSSGCNSSSTFLFDYANN